MGDFKPGDKVKKSGIYSVLHERHGEAHEVTCISGHTFPVCGECGGGVRFQLVKHARDIARDEHFKK